MTDLSALSDAQLQALYGAPSSAPDLSKMSNAELMAAYHGPSYAEDAAKSIGAGLGSAAIGTLGAVGDIRGLMSSGVDAIGNKTGLDLTAIKNAANAASYVLPGGRLVANAPTSQDIKSTVTDPIVSPDYEPKYESNRLLKKGAEFAPNMLLGGPEGLGARFLTNVAAPAVGSEVGEKLAGPYGGVAGALLSGAGATSAAQKFNAMAAARNAAKGIPGAEDTLKTAQGQFKAAEDMNVIVAPNWATSAAAKMRNDLKGFDPEAQGVVFRAADRLENLGKAPSPTISPAQRLQAEMNWEPVPAKPPAPPVAMNDVELIRKQLTAMKTDTNASVREAARKAIGSLQDSQLALTPAQTLRGNAAAYTQTTKDAIGNYAAGKRSNTVMGKAALGELNAATAGSGANEDNALRQAFKQLARPVNNDITPKWQRLGFNKEEGAAIEKVATGSAAGNTARYLGKYAPTGIVSAAGGAGLGHLIGGPVGAAIPVVGYVAKKIGDLSTKHAVSAVDSLVRSRSPLAAQVAAQLPSQIVQQLPAKTSRLLQALILADPVLSKQLAQPSGQPVGQPAAY